KGPAKVQLLNQRFGARGFDYAGNESADFPVWEAARERLVANAPPGLSRRLARVPRVVREFSPQPSRIPALVRALRCHQWSKNLLVFLPIIAAHGYFNFQAVTGAILLFMAWCLVASGIYVSNDFIDLEADRHHPTKRLRPFANGDLPLSLGTILAPTL